MNKQVEPAESKHVQQLAGESYIDNVKNAVVKLEKVEEYTTFLSEFGIKDGNIIVHFFLPAEVFVPALGKNGLQEQRPKPIALKYWTEVFPKVLSDTAEKYFGATKPRIFAEYVPEMTSWYLQCNGFGLRLSPEQYIRKYFDVLDAALDEALRAAGIQL